MKSNAPWSVKGIERDARETAKEAARREGMTVGEWLNQMIYSHGEEGGLSDSEVEGLKLRDIVTAIEHLRNRVVDAESKSAGAVSELTRTMGGFVDRVQRLERVKPAEGSDHDLALRVEKLERAGGDRHRIDALKALEKAVAQVAVQFNNAHRTTLTRLDSAEQQLQEFAERIDRVGAGSEPADVVSLKNAIEELAGRVARAEQISSEAADLNDAAATSSDPEFVERTGARLRVLGDEIKRGGDQIRALEGAIAKLAGQIEAAEKRSSEGVQKVAETIAEVRTQLLAEDERGEGDDNVEALLAAARRETEARIEALQRSLDDMNSRFEQLDQAQADSSVEALDDDTDEVVDAEETDIVSDELSADTDDDQLEGSDSVDDAIDEIEEAVASLDANLETEQDPFAFDETAETVVETDDDEEADDPAGDFSFEIDESDDEDSDDIAVSADFGDEDEGEAAAGSSDARSLLAEVRSALTGEGFNTPRDETNNEDDDEISDIITSLDGDEPQFDDAADDDDEQAPNTASLASGMAVDTDQSVDESDEIGSAETIDEAPKPAPSKQDYLKDARQRAKDAAARQSEDVAPTRRQQLTAKQRAILAARARQKRAALASGVEQPTLTQPIAATPATNEASAQTGTADLADETSAEESTTQTGGRFSKITAALNAARGRLARTKQEPDESAERETVAEQATPTKPAPEVDAALRNGDRAALETLQSTASSRPVTLALGVAIILAIAALIFLVKDFIFKPDADQPISISQPVQAPTDIAATENTDLPVVPEAPAIDPKTLYLDAIAALNAAEEEGAALSAVKQLQEAAALGYPPAQLQLGELYKTGQGVNQDLGQARVWFRRAAKGGNVLAMHRIGVMTARGDGGPADSQEAIGWFENAANFGLVDSQYNLGAIYHPSDDGTSSVQDAAKAYFWYALAARNGDTQAAPLAAGVAVALSQEQRAEIDTRVANWKANPADDTANLNVNAG